MNTFSKIGANIVVLALIAYSISFFNGQRKRKLGQIIRVFQSIGVILDITATIFMIIGSSKGPFTLHGILGYSSLAGMIFETYLVWRLSVKKGIHADFPKPFHHYSQFAYIWWILAFITGGLLVAFR